MPQLQDARIPKLDIDLIHPNEPHKQNQRREDFTNKVVVVVVVETAAKPVQSFRR